MIFPNSKGLIKIISFAFVVSGKASGFMFNLESDLKTKLDFNGLVTSLKENLLKRVFKENVFGVSKIKNVCFFTQQKIEQIVPARIIVHFSDDLKDLTNKNRFFHLKFVEEVQMTLEHLKTGVAVWLISFVFPIIAEWTVRCFDLIIFRRVFAFS